MTDYRAYLKQQLAERCRLNPRYSLRAFARDLAVSPSILSEVLNRKHGFSEEKARTVADRLGLSANEREKFVRSVLSTDGRSRDTRESARKALPEVDPNARAIHDLSLEAFRVLADWHHFAIIEYLQLKKRSHDPFDIAQALDLSTHVVQDALERLVKLEMIEKRATSFRVVKNFYISPDGIPSEAVRTFHRQILEKALQAITLQSVEQRELQNLVFAVDPRRLPALKKKIQNFCREVNVETLADTQKSTVYNLSVQLFELTPRLSQKGNKI